MTRDKTSTIEHYGEKDADSGTVIERYRGTRTDQHDMAVLGKKQVLRRNYHFITALGFSSTVMVGWETLPIYILYSLIDGGKPIMFWGLIVAAIGMTLVYASLSEIASMSPTAGGQYHWVSELAPPSSQKVLSYTVGWLTATGWQTYMAGVCYIDAVLVQGLIEFNVPTYEAQRWHGTLLTMAFMCFAIAFNALLSSKLPYILGTALVLHVTGLLGICITLLVMAPKTSGYDAIINFQDNGGWGNVGLSAMIGLIYPIGTLTGYDCSVHMSEETYDASRLLPTSIMCGAPLNSLLNILMGFTLIFTLGNPEDVINSTATEPFIPEIFFKVTKSHAGTNVMVAIIIILITAGCLSQLATASRQLWSFARDRGLPFSSWLSRVSPTRNIPINALFLSFIITCLISLLNLGSTVAINAINSLASVSVLTSYYLTLSTLLYRRLFDGRPLPPRRWSLGKWGISVNVAALLFLTPVVFFDFWPVMQPVTPANLNWGPVMFVGTLSVAAIFFLVWGRKEYAGPVVGVKRDE